MKLESSRGRFFSYNGEGNKGNGFACLDSLGTAAFMTRMRRCNRAGEMWKCSNGSVSPSRSGGSFRSAKRETCSTAVKAQRSRRGIATMAFPPGLALDFTPAIQGYIDYNIVCGSRV